MNSPWVAPGVYTVRLTANGQTLTQPITIKMDPRVKITPGVQQIFTLTARDGERCQERRGAYKEARGMIDKLKASRNLPRTTLCSRNWKRLAPVEEKRAGDGGGFAASDPARAVRRSPTR